MRAHTRKRINNIVLIFQDRKEIRIQLEKYYPENISIKEEYYYTKKNIIEEKGETQKNILPIKKNIVPLHTFERITRLITYILKLSNEGISN